MIIGKCIMRSARKILIQSAISYRICRLISCCRFFSCIAQKSLPTDYNGAASRSFIAGRLIAAVCACLYLLSDFPFLTVLPTQHNKPLLKRCFFQSIAGGYSQNE
jgi:hypothetical protein